MMETQRKEILQRLAHDIHLSPLADVCQLSMARDLGQAQEKAVAREKRNQLGSDNHTG